MTLLRLARALVATPWHVLRELFGAAHFDAFEAAQRQRLIDLAEGE